NREAVFARSVIVVEDESQQLFVLGVAPKLGFDLDAHGVSVIAVGGHDGYPPFFTLFQALAIPYVALRDKDWDHRRFDIQKFFELGCELEDFLDEHGLAQLRQDVISEVGTAKPRVAAELARRLNSDQVPELFLLVLQAADKQATGAPSEL